MWFDMHEDDTVPIKLLDSCFDLIANRWLSMTFKFGFTVTVTSTKLILPCELPFKSTNSMTPSTFAINFFNVSVSSASKPSVNVTTASQKISIAVLIIISPTISAVIVSIIGKPKIAPKIPIAVPILTSASERLS